MANGTFGIKQYITSGGVIAPNVDIIEDNVIKLVVLSAGVSNEITLYGRIGEQSNWNIVGTITGSGIKNFDVSLFDFVRLECTNFQAVGGRVDLTGSGFVITGFNTITTPDGDLVANGSLEFISSDNSVTFDNIAPNKIDIKAIGGGGGGSSKYTKVVTLLDWIGPSSGQYTLTIPFSFHAISNPVVACYESNGSDFDIILVPTMVDASNNVILTVSEIPDTRFIGKVILE